jgi:uncharacterized alkaline shock family protein YloU
MPAQNVQERVSATVRTMHALPNRTVHIAAANAMLINS